MLAAHIHVRGAHLRPTAKRRSSSSSGVCAQGTAGDCGRGQSTVYSGNLCYWEFPWSKNFSPIVLQKCPSEAEAEVRPSIPQISFCSPWSAQEPAPIAHDSRASRRCKTKVVRRARLWEIFQGGWLLQLAEAFRKARSVLSAARNGHARTAPASKVPLLQHMRSHKCAWHYPANDSMLRFAPVFSVAPKNDDGCHFPFAACLQEAATREILGDTPRSKCEHWTCRWLVTAVQQAASSTQGIM